MKQTAMQDLREDLFSTKSSSEQTLLEIENQQIREACQKVVRITLEAIIKRIDDELLEIEKQQIIDARLDGCISYSGKEVALISDLVVDAKQYYNETFKNK